MDSEQPSRRSVLRAVAAGTATVGGAGCMGGDGGGGSTATPSQYANQPVGEDSVTFGFPVALSGPFGSDGERQERGFRLAVKHLNEGGGWVDSGKFPALSGDGVLGRTVEMATGNTESSPDTAVSVARDLIASEGAVMIAGGSSGNTAVNLFDLCHPRGVVHMIGFAPGTNVTGADCSRYGFQEMFNPKMAAQALVPVLRDRFGDRANVYGLHANSDFGFTQANELRRLLLDNNWNYQGDTQTTVGTSEYRPQLEEAKAADPDVLALSYRGIDGANAIRQAREVFDDINIVAPLLSQTTAELAGEAIEGVVGTISWDPSIDTPLSETFRESFQQEFGEPEERPDWRLGSDQAHLAYGQTLQYAAAVERAGTFEPPAVIRELEGHQYAMGIGRETMRACDHQAIRPVPVVEGLPAADQAESRYYDFVTITRDVGYGCDEDPADDCREMGPYEPTTETG